MPHGHARLGSIIQSPQAFDGARCHWQILSTMTAITIKKAAPMAQLITIAADSRACISSFVGLSILQSQFYFWVHVNTDTNKKAQQSHKLLRFSGIYMQFFPPNTRAQ
jgi:hypothetical protein